MNDAVFLVLAFWPQTNAIKFWRCETFDSEEEAREAFQNHRDENYPDVLEAPYLLEVFQVSFNNILDVFVSRSTGK